MREHDSEVFSNPLPPEARHQHQHSDSEDEEHPLTNADFRKLLMTPGGPVKNQSSSSSSKTAEAHDATRSHHKSKDSKPEDDEDDAATRRRKKKSYYAKLKKIEDERQKELEKKYRDRARERREGGNKDYEPSEAISTTADYRAVAPDVVVKQGESYAERRKKIIQESKYLGGDMEHTHLVKGLDFALLEKVRAEISSKENHDDAVEEYLNQAIQQQHQKNAKQEKEEDPENFIEFRTKLARNVYRVACKSRVFERNELFIPGRMAYVVDLEDDSYADMTSDIPTTLIRSKADYGQASNQSSTIMSTNDIVISKLTQILTYLRQGKRDRKKLKKDKLGKKLDQQENERSTQKEKTTADDGIYPDGGHDYYPVLAGKGEPTARVRREPRDRDERGGGGGGGRRDDRDRRDGKRDYNNRQHQQQARDYDRREREQRSRDDRRDGGKRRSYFEKPLDEDEVRERPQQSAKELVSSINEKFAKPGTVGWSAADAARTADAGKPGKREEDRMKKIKKRMEIDSYAECYPGMEESADAVIDSDDEADYTKMDMGNKKGPVGRWDFENQEDYSNYMSSKEALPKAAFQYGVKMADGRKTRGRGPGPKDEKAQLDRQWQKIQNIIQKRKGAPDEPRHGGKSARH